MSRSLSDTDVLVATIGKPHGVRGLVRLHCAMEATETVEELGLLHDEHGGQWKVCWKSPGIASILAENGQVLSDRTSVEKLVNYRLYAKRDLLPETDEEEFYHVDLLGMKAVLLSGESLGTVIKVHDYGAGTSLELDQGQIIPFTLACVPEVDRKTHTLVVDLPNIVEVEGDLSGDVNIRT